METNGWSSDSVIKVFEHETGKYILDGHHRADAASRIPGMEALYEVVSEADLPKWGYDTVEQMIWSHFEVGGL
jgi:uncharacterized protein (DUF1015 family)